MRRFLIVFAMACGQPTPPACLGEVTSVVVVSTDFSSSAVGALPLDGSPPSLSFGSQLGVDPALASSHGRRFFIARDLDSIFEMDLCGRATANFSARAAGETVNVNPQDLAVAPNGALWIARFSAVPSILVTGSGTTPNAIDLSKFDADGNPDASSVRIVGTPGNAMAFVALERLTNSQSIQPSQVAVLDTSTLALVTTITLAGRNPFGQMKEANGKLWIAAPGDFFDASEPDAGIEVLDTASLTSSLVFTETALGGSVVEVAVDDAGACGVAILADATTTNHTSLVSFAVGSSVVTQVIAPTDGFNLRGLLFTKGNLLVADTRSTQAGFPVHVFAESQATCALSPSTDLIVPTLPALAFSN